MVVRYFRIAGTIAGNLEGNKKVIIRSISEDVSPVTLVGTSITFFKLNLLSRLVNLLFKERSHEDDKLILNSPISFFPLPQKARGGKKSNQGVYRPNQSVVTGNGELNQSR